MLDLKKKYNFDAVELKWQKKWQETNIYRWDSSESRENTYVVDTPPATVSGQLHIGHVYSYTHTDFIVRYQRMKGMNVFYPMGFDDNGLPSERLVQKKKKIKPTQLNREEFRKICSELVEVEEENFYTLFNRIALSVDWNLKYKTISDHSCRISQLSFLDLFEKQQLYRASEPILWDPIDQTALAQADVESKERSSFIHEIEFKTESDKKIVIATTRPELLRACVTIFYHPDDKRYQELNGKFAISPLFSFRVPILPDSNVSQDKGTGLVMCCTFGDQMDVVWWRTHKLPTKIIITKYGTLDQADLDDHNESLDPDSSEKFFQQIQGLKISDAKVKIVELLKENGSLLVTEEKQQILHCAERSGAPLEILTTPQWFIRSKKYKSEMLELSGKLNWHPKSMKIKLDSWINNISLDWCISRQRYFGVPFPVWYSKKPGEEGKILLPTIDQLPVDPIYDLPKGYTRDEVEADLDIMDTWATSAVSVQLSSHGVSDRYMVDQERHDAIFPADLRPQSHEIIRTWTYYTMLKSYLHTEKLPWKHIMLSGWCLAHDKSKMSKSKGNVIIPENSINQYGADVLRYWSANSALGVDTVYSEDVLKQGKRLVNKLWNASKFIAQHFEHIPPQDRKLNDVDLQNKITSDFDKYFLLQLRDLVYSATQDFENYQYSFAMSKVEKFFFSDFCDNYIEITKNRAYQIDDVNDNIENSNNINDTDNLEQGDNMAQGDNHLAFSARITLYHSLLTILKLFAPFMPHITAEIFCTLYAADDDHNEQSIHSRGSWPVCDIDFINFDNTGSKFLLGIVDLVRKLKSREQISIKAPVDSIEIESTSEFAAQDYFSDNLLSDLQNVVSVGNIRFVDSVSDYDEIIQEGKTLKVKIIL